MTIRYEPKKLLKKMAPDDVLLRLVTQKLTLNRAVLRTVARANPLLDQDALEDVALNVLSNYKDRYADAREDGANKSDAFSDATTDQRLMVQRVQNATVAEAGARLKERYRGTRYRWLPSTAAVPDAAHRRKWNKVYTLGKGEAPGDRYGCQCGMLILTDDDEFDFEDDDE